MYLVKPSSFLSCTVTPTIAFNTIFSSPNSNVLTSEPEYHKTQTSTNQTHQNKLKTNLKTHHNTSAIPRPNQHPSSHNIPDQVGLMTHACTSENLS